MPRPHIIARAIASCSGQQLTTTRRIAYRFEDLLTIELPPSVQTQRDLPRDRRVFRDRFGGLVECLRTKKSLLILVYAKRIKQAISVLEIRAATRLQIKLVVEEMHLRKAAGIIAGKVIDDPRERRLDLSHGC